MNWVLDNIEFIITSIAGSITFFLFGRYRLRSERKTLSADGDRALVEILETVKEKLAASYAENFKLLDENSKKEFVLNCIQRECPTCYAKIMDRIAELLIDQLDDDKA